MLKEMVLLEPITIYQLLGLLGIPSLFAGLVGWLVSDLKAKKLQREMDKSEERKEFSALRLGLQALLRAEMIQSYSEWSERGWMPIDVKDSFENIWTQYHNMGKNGVMDDIHEKAMDLPTSRPKSKD